MQKSLLYKLGTVAGFSLLASEVLAAPLEAVQTFMGMLPMYALLLYGVIVTVYVIFARFRDKRAAPVNSIFEAYETIHAVAPETLVTECVRTMTSAKIGAVVVMNGEKLVGIFTERDALNKVLAAELDPGKTKVSEVMTKDPYCIAPTTSVSEAMHLVTDRRVRHLPVVENGKVLAVVSSGDLTHWLVKDQTGRVQELVEVAAKS
jgi:CBS domain-containing protein